MMTSTTKTRDKFINYYQDMGYQLLPRSPMIDPSIPMSFVMSAGLVQVEASLARKNIRNGSHFVLSQECFRYFDLEKVGTDGFHLSLFEMPGSFVFGPINKERTVKEMWYLATEILNIDPSRIWASFFGGGYILGKHKEPEDTIVRNTWIAEGIPEERVIALGPEHNYWVQGKGIEDSGTIRKCGTNTELFYDFGQEKTCGNNCKPGCKCGRFLEFSNSLFISGRIAENAKEITSLDNPFTETVIGTERVDVIRHKVGTVFEINTLQKIIITIDKFRNTSTKLQKTTVITYERVIADHLRALFRLVADNAPPPGKDGRARIIKILIRRILAREILLGIDHEIFLPFIANHVISTMNIENPNVTKHHVLEYFEKERQRFSKTLIRGERKLLALLENNKGNTLSGEQIVFLEKKWGLPNIITRAYLEKEKLPYKKEEYQKAIRLFTL